MSAILYINRAGCQWDMLPHDFPDFKTVSWYDNEWRQSRRWDTIMNALRDVVRKNAKKNEAPSVACIDGQTAKTADQGVMSDTTEVSKPTNTKGMCDRLSWIAVDCLCDARDTAAAGSILRQLHKGLTEAN